MLRNLFAVAILLAMVSSALAAEMQSCRLSGISTTVSCGSIKRALDPAAPAGKQIDIHFAVIPAKARNKHPDPVVFLAGGPGQSAIGLASQLGGMMTRLNFRRDIVLVDQRGTGHSFPLRCNEVREDLKKRPEHPADLVPLLKSCRQRLVREHGLAGEAALGFVTTTLAMQDLDAVRADLGAEKINLIGVSYGTRAALEYVRLYPQRVRRVVLDGVAPADMNLIESMGHDQQQALRALFDSCAKEKSCAAQGDLGKDWAALLASLPRQIIIPDPLTGTATALRLQRWMLEGVAAGALYSATTASALPLAIRRARDGDFVALSGLLSRSMPTDEQAIAMGMHYGVICAEDFPRLGTSAGAGADEFGSGIRLAYAAACKDWPVIKVAPEFYTGTAATAATLMLGGGIDPVTPPRHMQRIAKILGPKAKALTANNLGHNVLASACGRRIVNDFVNAIEDDDALTIETDCLARIPRPLALEAFVAGEKE
jgi:pimeloyl-ACP methyl ester carboxylesterase